MHHGSCFLQYGRQQPTFVLFYSTVASSPSSQVDFGLRPFLGCGASARYTWRVDQVGALRQARSAAELKRHGFSSAPVVSPRNECRNAIIRQRVLEYAREHGRRVKRYRATDHVRAAPRMEDDPSVWSVFDNNKPGGADGAAVPSAVHAVQRLYSYRALI
jgi:hypothetical protein